MTDLNENINSILIQEYWSRVVSLESIRLIHSRVKSNASGFFSNFYSNPQKIQQWIVNDELYYYEKNDAAFFLRSDQNVWHLYFFSANHDALVRELNANSFVKNQFVVTDLVYKGEDTKITPLLALSGFSPYRHLFRMCYVPEKSESINTLADEHDIHLADKLDTDQILSLLKSSFDILAEQLPPPHEIESAIEAKQIWVARVPSGLGGLLFFETQGVTSLLRYWLIAPALRGKGIGKKLMQVYFSLHPNVQRFLLWVMSDNEDVISRYKHYGYIPDGLINQVLINEKLLIRPR